MAAIVMPSEEECYLLAILESPDGLDLAEFTWFDPETDDGCYRAWDFQWCLRGDTVMYTDQGRRRLDECVGDVRLLSAGDHGRGTWVDAHVTSYGPARIWRVDLERQGVTRSIWCTSEHRWYAGAGRADRRIYTERPTRELIVGDRLQPMAAPRIPISFDRRWVQAGIVMGDGTVYGVPESRRSKVVLYGDKQCLTPWFDKRPVAHRNGNTDVPAQRITNLPAAYKSDLPAPGHDKASALWGWLAGYFATDGSVLPDGTCVITSISSRQMLRVRDVATALGIRCSPIGHRDVESVLPGGRSHRSVELRVVLNPSDLDDAFFLRPDHFFKHLVTEAKRERATPAWQVVAVQETDEISEVFCAEVEGDHSFVLDGDILTGNSWYTCNDMQQIDQGGRALGKALALDTPIPTPGGWSTMGELTDGDQVLDESGRPCTVTQVHEVRLGRPCYEVQFSDGSVVIADAEHRWLTWSRAERKAATRSVHGGPGPQVRTTEQIAATLKVGTENNHSIPLAGPLLLPEAELEIDPYVLGAWLGDGTSRSNEITLGEAKHAVLSEIYSRAYAVRRRAPQPDRAPTYAIEFDRTISSRKRDGFQATLRRIGVLENKHIPAIYLRASLGQRYALLHGLFDTDGHLTRESHAELSFTNMRLAQDAFELLASLGEQPHWAKGPAKLNGIEVGTRYRITWRPLINPALRRGGDRFYEATHQRTKITQRRIVTVRPVPSVPVRCITVDSPNHLYLAGGSMIPTHNTVGIKMRAGAFPFAYEGQSMLLTAPELNHLRPLTDMIERTLLSTRLLREMLPDGKGKGIARQPHWQVRFKNGTNLVSRLPNKDGKGVKGQHVINIELDEAQDYPMAGWIEIVETLNAGLPGAMWRCHGVSKGVRDKFHEKTQPMSGWTVHRPMAMNRPTWGPEEREKKIREYGMSRQSIDYRRNIYGEHGDASNSVFVLARLMDCVDLDEGSTYNADVYQKVMMSYESFPNGASDDERLQLMHSWIDLPGTHKHGYSQKIGSREVGSPNGYSFYWAGMDVGVTNHPSEILVYGQRTGTDFLEMLTRIQMHRINTDDQKQVVAMVMDFYGSKIRFGIDKTGVGFPIWDQLTRTSYGARVYGFGFSEKRVAAIEDRELTGSETIKDLAIYRNFVEASTDWLRNDYIDVKKMRMPYDKEVLQEFQGQTYTVIKNTGDPYGQKRLFSGGSFHTLDAAKIAVATKHIPPLEDLLDKQPKQASVLDVFVGM